MGSTFSKRSILAQAASRQEQRTTMISCFNPEGLCKSKGRSVFMSIESFSILLKNIEYLLFGLFQFIFHQHHALLYGGIIGFGTCSVDLTAYFLQDEGELLSFAFL